MTRKEELLKIQVGDRVVIQGHFNIRIVQVTHTTPTQIVIGRNRYGRERGNAIGGSSVLGTLIGRATPEQITEWEATQAARLVESRTRQEQADAKNDERLALNALLPEKGYVVLREEGTFTVCLPGCDTARVKEIAQALSVTKRRCCGNPDCGGRHTCWAPVRCQACGWQGRTMDTVHGYEASSLDEVEPMDSCPDCLSSNLGVVT
jgi:hypothetical protein